MIYSLYFIQSWFMFVTPLKFLRHKSTIGQKVSFTIIYGIGVILLRSMYDFLEVPFGTHTLLSIILNIILLKIILKDFSWQKSVYVSLITFIALLVNDSFIVLPIVKLLNLSIGNIEPGNIPATMAFCVLPSLLLILAYIVLAVRDLARGRKNPNDTVPKTISGK